jgi:ATP-dependent protease ClpP protease subunit
MKSNLWLVILVVYMLGVFSCESHAKGKIRTIDLNEMNSLGFAQYINPYAVDLTMSAVTAKSLMVKDDPLYLVVASYGGEYFSAKVLKFYLDRVPNLTLICTNCQSAAGMIFGTSSHKRLVTTKSIVMMHEMYVQKVTANQITKQSLVESLQRDSREFNLLMANKLDMPVDKYEDKIRDAEWTLEGKDIVDAGLADEVVRIRCNDYVKAVMPVTCGDE